MHCVQYSAFFFYAERQKKISHLLEQDFWNQYLIQRYYLICSLWSVMSFKNKIFLRLIEFIVFTKS